MPWPITSLFYRCYMSPLPLHLQLSMDDPCDTFVILLQIARGLAE